jgi:hypothetical protein
MDKIEMNPDECINSTAENLTPEQVTKYFCDSYRPQHAFIRTNEDPNYVYGENREIVTSTGPRQWGLVSFHILKAPLIIDDDPTKCIVGYYKLRGPGAFVDENEANHFASKIYTEHDSYTTMYSTPYGVIQPIITTILSEKLKPQVEELYNEEVKSQNSQIEAFLIEQRKIEERARKLSGGIEEESIEDYVKQQLRRHAADKKIMDAKKLIDECDKIVKDSHKRIVKMHKEHPDWKREAFEYYRRTMVELGEKEPKSFYDQ